MSLTRKLTTVRCAVVIQQYLCQMRHNFACSIRQHFLWHFRHTLGMMTSFNVGSDDGVKHSSLLNHSHLLMHSCFFAFVIKIAIKNCPLGTTPIYLHLFVYEVLFFKVFPDIWITRSLQKKSMRFVFIVLFLVNFKRKTLNAELYLNLI